MSGRAFLFLIACLATALLFSVVVWVATNPNGLHRAYDKAISK